MAKDRVELARIASPEEIAEYLTSLAVGLKRGEVSLESGDRGLRLSSASEVKLELKVVQKERKGKIALEIGWKRPADARTSELRRRRRSPARAQLASSSPPGPIPPGDSVGYVNFYLAVIAC